MGRPPLPANLKRQQINARVSPEDREALEAMAGQEGVALGALAERLLIEQLRRRSLYDPETLNLLDEVGREILAIKSHTGKSWHRDLRTWSATAQMFERGPIKRRRPDRPDDDEVVSYALDKAVQCGTERMRTAEMLKALGVSVSDDPRAFSLFGYRRRGMFGAGLSDAIESTRPKEREAIMAIEDQGLRQAALFLFERLEQQDQEYEQAQQDYSAAVAPYHQMEMEGRDLYDKLTGVASAIYDSTPEPVPFAQKGTANVPPL